MISSSDMHLARYMNGQASNISNISVLVYNFSKSDL